MANKLTKTFRLPCYDTDASGRMKAFAFMNYAQEAANEHAELMGFGYDTLIQSRVVWILSRFHLHFDQYPHWKDKVTFTTWHKGLDRMFFLRDYILEAEDGTTLARATSSWLTLNIDSRKLVRDPGLVGEEMDIKEDVLPEACGKIRMPKNVAGEFVREHEVVYSDVDFNGHANNAMYCFWSLDVLGYEFMLQHELKDLYINFNHETKAGDRIAFFRYCTEEEGRTVVYVEGRVGGQEDDPESGTSSFTVKCVF